MLVLVEFAVMAQIVRLIFEIPEGVSVKIEGLEPSAVAPDISPADAVRDYWRHYLSGNSCKVFRAAAAIEGLNGPGFTLEDVATNLRMPYATVRSLHRTSGRAAKKWREEKGIEVPVRLDEVDYPETPNGVGRRTRYRLPDGVRELIIALTAEAWSIADGSTVPDGSSRDAD